jgi:hypothetical protein
MYLLTSNSSLLSDKEGSTIYYVFKLSVEHYKIFSDANLKCLIYKTTYNLSHIFVSFPLLRISSAKLFWSSSIMIARFFFFFFAFPLSPNRPIRYLLRSAWFLIFSFVVRRGSGVLSPATHAHPLSSPFFWTTQHEYHNTQHPWEAHPAWDLNPADLAMVSGECRSSLHHPTVSPY